MKYEVSKDNYVGLLWGRPVTTKERIALIRRTSNGTIVNYFREPRYNEWLEAVKRGYSPSSIPEKFHDKKLYVAVAQCDYFSHFTIPDIFWKNNPEHASESLVEVLEICPQMIHNIPPKRITKKHLITAFQTARSEGFTFNEDRFAEIPLSSWDADTVQMALAEDPASIEIVPEKYLTEADALRCAKNPEVHEGTIPKRLHTRRVLVSLAATSGGFSSSSYGGLVNNLQFQLDVIKEGGFESAKSLLHDYIQPENYVKIIKVCPEYIQLIPKLKQTDKIIDVLLGATAEILDGVAEYINLSKIKGYHAPLLIGCKSPILQSIIEKKLRGKQKKNLTKVNPHTIEIDMAPGEFASIRSTIE